MMPLFRLRHCLNEAALLFGASEPFTLLAKRSGLNRSCYGDYGNTGCYGYNSRFSVLRIGCGRYGNLSGKRRKLARRFVVGVVRILCPSRTVVGHADRIENRCEGVGDNYVVGCDSLRISAILNNEGIGYFSVVGYDRGAYSLGYREICVLSRRDGSLAYDIRNAVRRNGCCIHDRSFSRLWRELIGSRLVDDRGIRILGNGYA